MNRTKILKLLKKDIETIFELEDISIKINTKNYTQARDVFSNVARNLGFRLVDVCEAIKRNHSTVLMYTKGRGGLDATEKAINKKVIADLTKKYNINNFLKCVTQ